MGAQGACRDAPPGSRHGRKRVARLMRRAGIRGTSPKPWIRPLSRTADPAAFAWVDARSLSVTYARRWNLPDHQLVWLAKVPTGVRARRQAGWRL